MRHVYASYAATRLAQLPVNDYVDACRPGAARQPKHATGCRWRRAAAAPRHGRLMPILIYAPLRHYGRRRRAPRRYGSRFSDTRYYCVGYARLLLGYVAMLHMLLPPDIAAPALMLIRRCAH